MLCLLLLLPSTASIAALNEEETRSWKKGCKAQVMSWNINLIFESFLSLFLACFIQACLSNYSSIAKGRLKGQSLGSSLAGTWAGVAWGAGAEQSSLCAVRDPVSVPRCHRSGLQEGLPAQPRAAESRTFTYLLPTNSRKLITFDTTYFFASFFFSPLPN